MELRIILGIARKAHGAAHAQHGVAKFADGACAAVRRESPQVDEVAHVLKADARRIGALDDVVYRFGQVKPARLGKLHRRRDAAHDLVEIPSRVCCLGYGVCYVVCVEDRRRSPLRRRNVKLAHDGVKLLCAPSVGGGKGHLGVRHALFVFTIDVYAVLAEVDKLLADSVYHASEFGQRRAYLGKTVTYSRVYRNNGFKRLARHNLTALLSCGHSPQSIFPVPSGNRKKYTMSPLA